MGVISRLAENSSSQAWQEVFGNKEERPRQPMPTSGRSSVVGTDASVKRLVEAMRSRSPGGWSDDRWEQSRHFSGIQYICIHRVGEQLAQSEFQVFIKDDNHVNGKRPVPRHHAGYELVKLLERPNNDDSFGDWLYRLNQQLDLTGTALTWMLPNVLGKPFELYCVPTAIAIPQPVINPEFPDGYYRIQPLYPYGPFSSYPTPATAVGAPIAAQWMLRMTYPHPLLRWDGYSPLTALRLHIDEVESMDRSRWYAMKRAISPSAVLNFEDTEAYQPLPEEEIERIRSEFETSHQGPENVGQLFVSTPGAKLEQWGSKPVDMEYQGGWDQLVSFVMAGYGITKPAAGMIEDVSYSALFATLKQLHLLTLNPKARRIAAKLTKHLAPYFGDDLIIEIRCQRIDDHDVRNQRLDRLMQGKAITKNELRMELDMPLTSESWGGEVVGNDPQQSGSPDMGQVPLEPGKPGAKVPEPRPMGMPKASKQEETRLEPYHEVREKPRPGRLGLGAEGPEKSLNGRSNGVLKHA